jgi:hypothetical protein
MGNSNLSFSPHIILICKEICFKLLVNTCSSWQTTCILCVTWTISPEYDTNYFICAFLTFLHWISNTVVLHHKVNGPYMFMYSPWQFEWIHTFLTTSTRFNITWSPSLFLIGRWVDYLSLLNLPLHFQNNFLSIWGLFFSRIWHWLLSYYMVG